MAIQNRRGIYYDFDPGKMVAGELAVVQEGDADSSTGRALYICFEPGIVKRICDYDDVADIFAHSAETYIDDLEEIVSNAQTAASSATSAASSAISAAADATNAAEAVSQIFDYIRNSILGQGFGTSNSYTSGTSIVSLADYQIVEGGIVAVRFNTVPDSLNALNINSRGAIQIRCSSREGTFASVPSGTIKSGDVGVFMYDGTYYVLLTVFRSAEFNRPLWVDMGTVSSLPQTKYNSLIESSMICTGYEVGNPSAQKGDWTVNTANGSVAVSGNVSGSTSLKIKLENVRSI